MPVILSIDIGVKNLAYAIITYPAITFDVIDISKPNNAVDRCRLIQDLIGNIIKENHVSYVVIEKQFSQNTVAMELMYSIITIAITLTGNAYLFDPKEKFTYLDLEYDTKNKAHKKLSVDIARNFLKNLEEDHFDSWNTFQMPYNFEKYKKQDDIADAINQGMIYGLKNKLIHITKEEYKEMIFEN